MYKINLQPINGYGITDPTYSIDRFGITEGSANPLLKTNGAGNFTFTSALSGVSIVNGSSINSIPNRITPFPF